MINDYHKYRGKCKELSEEAIIKDPSLTLKRGWYHCHIWGEQAHWWTVRPDGSIYDPSKDQFPSKGRGRYEEFSGFFKCEECGAEVAEEDVVPCGNYPVCSVVCAMKLVGIYNA